jgi:hypothetical protein
MSARKGRNGLPLNEFLKEELADSKVRKHYEAARAESLVAKRVKTDQTLTPRR